MKGAQIKDYFLTEFNRKYPLILIFQRGAHLKIGIPSFSKWGLGEIFRSQNGAPFISG